MKKILYIPLSIITYLMFYLLLCIFDPIQRVCLYIFGYQAHKKSTDILNLLLVKVLLVSCIDFKFENIHLIPKDKPLIIVANHQSLFDIIGISWFMRKFHVKYVSKKELGKGVPSVSFNLNHGGSVLIDRKDPKQALPVLKQMGEYISSTQRSVVIFPEGTRSRSGEPKPFSANGLKILCKYAPNAYVVPISINNSWKVFRFGGFPLDMFNQIKFTVHEPIAVKEFDFNTLFEKTEKAIVSSIEK